MNEFILEDLHKVWFKDEYELYKNYCESNLLIQNQEELNKFIDKSILNGVIEKIKS